MKASTVEAYLAALPGERRAQVERVRAPVREAVPAAHEGLQWNMIGWAIAERPFAAVAAHKSYLSLYLMDLYTQPGLRERHAQALASLKMGKSCINFENVEELPLDAIRAILRAAPGVEVTHGTLAAQTGRKPAKTATANKKPAKKAR